VKFANFYKYNCENNLHIQLLESELIVVIVYKKMRHDMYVYYITSTYTTVPLKFY